MNLDVTPTIPGLRFRTDPYNMAEMRLIQQIGRLGDDTQAAAPLVLDLLYLRVDPACRAALDAVTAEDLPTVFAMASKAMEVATALTAMAVSLAPGANLATGSDRAYPKPNRARRRRRVTRGRR